MTDVLPQIVTAAATLLGVLITGAVNWVLQRSRNQQDLIRERLKWQRDEARVSYADLISAALNFRATFAKAAATTFNVASDKPAIQAATREIHERHNELTTRFYVVELIGEEESVVPEARKLINFSDSLVNFAVHHFHEPSGGMPQEEWGPILEKVNKILHEFTMGTVSVTLTAREALGFKHASGTLESQV